MIDDGSVHAHVGHAEPRCPWAGADPLMIAYHDHEWGRPVHDDRVLFEFLILEGAQAGLSWQTILRKREGYRRLFAGFDPAAIARFGPAQVDALLADASIVRHRGKIEAAVANAQAMRELHRGGGSLDALVWRFAPAPRPRRRTLAEVPAKTPESDALSKALKARGFKFVGSTTCYAFMQACGLVDDHLATCRCATR